jgi:hypothetical protein
VLSRLDLAFFFVSVPQTDGRGTSFDFHSSGPELSIIREILQKGSDIRRDVSWLVYFGFVLCLPLELDRSTKSHDAGRKINLLRVISWIAFAGQGKGFSIFAPSEIWLG